MDHEKTLSHFHVHLHLGNAAMLTGSDVAAALRDIADSIDLEGGPTLTGEHTSTIRDANGNTVGHWEAS